MKKLAMLILVIFFVVSPVANVYAAECVQDKYDICAGIRALLLSVELEKEKYGFENVDMGRLNLGSEIPAFITTRYGVIRQESIQYYPIISNSHWIATVSVTINDSNERVMGLFIDYSIAAESITTDIVGKKVAIVFDNRYGYVFVDNNSVVVEEYTEVEDRPELKQNELGSVKNVAPVSIEREINYMNMNIFLRDPFNCTILSVPAVTQPTNYTCWAASDAAIARYYGFSSTTVNQICNKAQTDLYTPKTIYEAMAVLVGNPYHLSYGGLYTKLKMITLQTEICLNRAPMFAAFGSGNNGASSGHAVVVRGFVNLPNSNIETMSYMDPKSGTYKVSTVPDSGAVTITHSGNTLSIKNACGVYD